VDPQGKMHVFHALLAAVLLCLLIGCGAHALWHEHVPACILLVSMIAVSIVES